MSMHQSGEMNHISSKYKFLSKVITCSNVCCRKIKFQDLRRDLTRYILESYKQGKQLYVYKNGPYYSCEEDSDKTAVQLEMNRSTFEKDNWENWVCGMRQKRRCTWRLELAAQFNKMKTLGKIESLKRHSEFHFDCVDF